MAMKGILHSTDFQNWCLTIRYSLVLHPEYLFFAEDTVDVLYIKLISKLLVNKIVADIYMYIYIYIQCGLDKWFECESW